MAGLQYSPRFTSSLGRLLDLASLLLTYPWLLAASLLASSLLALVPDPRPAWRRLADTAVTAPLLLGLGLVLTPPAVLGHLLWLTICTLCPSQQYSSVDIPKPKLKPSNSDGNKYSFGTMNILLGQEVIGKFNNCSLVYSRIPRIAAQIRAQEAEYLQNLAGTECPVKTETVLSTFPRMDFICFQEVFDRVHALALVSLLRSHYSHFIYDIGDNSLATNLFLLNSGLMVASNFPITKVHFHPFSWKTSAWQKCICYGVVVCKVDLGPGKVGLLSNLHTMAYEGPDPLINAALTEVKNVVTKFR